jgi:hypothetical protein
VTHQTRPGSTRRRSAGNASSTRRRVDPARVRPESNALGDRPCAHGGGRADGARWPAVVAVDRSGGSGPLQSSRDVLRASASLSVASATEGDPAQRTRARSTASGIELSDRVCRRTSRPETAQKSRCCEPIQVGDALVAGRRGVGGLLDAQGGRGGAREIVRSHLYDRSDEPRRGAVLVIAQGASPVW